jgi:hypothetical protein
MPPPYGIIRERLRAGLVVPFLGAGVHMPNRPAGATYPPAVPPPFLPSGSELAEVLATHSAFPSDDPAERRDLPKVASFYVDQAGRDALRNSLRDVFDHSYDFHPTFDVHKRLAACPKPLLIVTTNYDDLMERALCEAGRPYDMVVYPTDRPDIEASVVVWRHGKLEPETVDPSSLTLDFNRFVVYKMHGTVVRDDPENTRSKALAAWATVSEDSRSLPHWDSYVISEEDYIDFLSRLTREQAVPGVLMRQFARRHFLFLGYSLRDWNLRVVLNNLRNVLTAGGPGMAPGSRSWAIQHAPTDVERRLWGSRGVNIYDNGITQFVEELGAL